MKAKKCVKCNNEIKGDEFIIMYNVYCEQCYKKHIKKCTHCNQEYLETKTIFMITKNNEEVCKKCYNDYYTICNKCKEITKIEDIYIEKNKCICKDCIEEENNTINKNLEKSFLSTKIFASCFFDIPIGIKARLSSQIGDIDIYMSLRFEDFYNIEQYIKETNGLTLNEKLYEIFDSNSVLLLFTDKETKEIHNICYMSGFIVNEKKAIVFSKMYGKKIEYEKEIKLKNTIASKIYECHWKQYPARYYPINNGIILNTFWHIAFTETTIFAYKLINKAKPAICIKCNKHKPINQETGVCYMCSD